MGWWKRGLLVLTGLLAPICLHSAPLECSTLDPNQFPNGSCVATREVSLFAGTLTVNGVPEGPFHLVWSSDSLTATVLARLNDDAASLDPRVTAPGALTPFLIGMNDVDWTLGGPDNLISALVSQGQTLDGLFGAGSLSLHSPTALQGPNTYILAQFTTFEPGPCEFDICEIANTYQTRVSIYEQNATWSLQAVPEPGSATFMIAGMAALGLAARSKSKR